MYITALFLSLCAIRSVIAESRLSENTRNCRIGAHKSEPALVCQVKDSAGNWAKTEAYKELGTFLVNEHNVLKFRRNGAAPDSCDGFTYDSESGILGADCGGKAVTLINLNEVCSTNDGKIVCDVGQSTTEPATTSSSGRTATPAAAPDPETSSNSSQDSTSSPTETPTPSQTADLAADTSSSAPTSTNVPNACDSAHKRMRFMERSER